MITGEVAIKFALPHRLTFGFVIETIASLHKTKCEQRKLFREFGMGVLNAQNQFNAG